MREGRTKKIGKLLINLLLRAEAWGLFLQSNRGPATLTCTHGLSKCNKPLARRKKSPWRNKSTPPGPQGLHSVGALARTHRGLEYETPSHQELLRAESRQNLKESISSNAL